MANQIIDSGLDQYLVVSDFGAVDIAKLMPDSKLLDAIQSLSPLDQTILLQIFVGGLKQREIAGILKITHQAVSQRKQAALKKLRSILAA